MPDSSELPGSQDAPVPRDREPSRGRRAAINLAVLALALALCAVAGEAVVRALYGSQIALFPRFHSRADYEGFTLRRLRPSSSFRHTSADGSWEFTVNAQGFRDFEDYAYEKAGGELRVLVLGDSHTQGFEVRQERTYSEVIERQLERNGIDAQVLNTGVSGFGTAEELAFLLSEGLRYEPDFVLLGFFANDFDDSLKAGLFSVRHGELRIGKREHIPGVRVLDVIHAVPGLAWLSQRSYLYSLALNSTWDSAKRMLLDRAQSELQTEHAVATGELTKLKKDLVRNLIARLYHTCRRNGIPLIILDIPQVSGSGIASSVSSDLELHFRDSSDVYISSNEALGGYVGLAELHVPRGQRHISELTHLMLGMKAAEAIRDSVALITAGRER